MGFVLLLTTACSRPTIQGARPDNPSVQMGGNNPYEGAGYDHSGIKTEASRQRNISALMPDQARVPDQNQFYLVSNSLTHSYSLAAENEAKLPYPGTGMQNDDAYRVDLAETEAKRQEAQQIPKERQYIVDRSNPDAKILERSVQAFKSASEFLNDRSRSI